MEPFPNSVENDFELLYMIRQHDDGAYELLCKKYRPLICQIVIRSVYYHYRDLIKEDLIQEGMGVLSTSVDCFRDDGGAVFSTFCGICVSRKIKDIVRKIKSGRYLVCFDGISLDREIDPDGTSYFELVEDTHYEYRPKEHLDAQLLKDEINKASKRLTENERKIMAYRCRGFNYENIARMMDISRKNVDNTLQRSRKKIENQLIKEEIL